MADKMLQEQHHDVGNNGEKTLPKGFCPDYFHRLRFVRDNSDFYIQQENIESFRALPWYSKNLENSANRFQSVSETKDILKNLIYRNCAGDAKGVSGKHKTEVDGGNAPGFKTTRPDNLKTWTAYGNFDRNHKKPVIGTKADYNEIVSQGDTATTFDSKTNEVDRTTSTHQKTSIHGKLQKDRLKQQLLTKHIMEQYDRLSIRCSYDTRADTDVKTSSSTETQNSKQLVNEAAEELKEAGEKEKKTDKGRLNFLTKLWRRITRQPHEKTSAEKENKVNATVKKHSRFSSFLCSREPKTNM